MKIIATLVLVAMVVLLIPTGLVLASQEAVPGDLTYPVKRSLEAAIVKVASLNPYTSAFFDIGLSKRRYQEASKLLIRGSDATQTLNELIAQTKTASQQLNQVSDPNQKQQLVASLNQQIDEYKKGLTRIEQNQQTNNLSRPAPQPPITSQNPTPLPPQIPSVVNNPAGPQPTPSPTPPGSTVQPTAAPSLAPVATPRPTPIQSGSDLIGSGPTPPPVPPAPSPTPVQPVPTPRAPIGPAPSAPAPALPTGSVCQPGDLQCFINQLGEIQNNLESESQRPRQEHNQRGGSGNNRTGLANPEGNHR